jgi:AcrR family transcriptional regulator
MAKKKPTVRRSHAERRTQARERLLNACIDLLIERGYARLTVAQVAARAELSLGAQTNYYRTKLDLVAAAAAYSQDVAVQMADKLAEKARNSREPLSAFIGNAQDFYLDRSYLAMIELLVAARTDPQVAERFLPLIEAARRHINDAWLQVFLLAGLPERKARELLHMTLFLMRGMALASLLPLDRHEISRCLASWRTLIAKALAAARGPGTKTGGRTAKAGRPAAPTARSTRRSPTESPTKSSPGSPRRSPTKSPVR